MSFSCVCCQVLSLRRADHSSRGVLPSVVYGCVWSRNLVNGEALAYWWLLRKTNKQTNKHSVHFCGWFRCHYVVSHSKHGYHNFRISVLALLLLSQQRLFNSWS
jgi:hypothetical protein